MSNEENKEVHAYGDSETKRQIPKLSISVDRNAEIDVSKRKMQNLGLLLKKWQKKSFRHDANEYGVNPNNADVETLKAIERESRQAPISPEGSTAPLNAQQIYGKGEESDICKPRFRPRILRIYTIWRLP